jgi:2-amino-4-hydroxy-6-hydroxymethyldihydropteridine diphosphokinase
VAAVVIALGSNLGDRLANLRAAVAELKQRGVVVERCSSVWETEPVPPGQPFFLNAVLVSETGIEPLALLSLLKAIEREMGRTEGRRWGPRPIDLDILFYDDLRMDTEALTIPHPRIAERAFVLAPLAEVVTGPLPVLGRSAAELLAKLAASSASRIGPLDDR